MGDIANKTKNVELQRFVLNEYHLQSEELTAFDVFITDKWFLNTVIIVKDWLNSTITSVRFVDLEEQINDKKAYV